MKWWLHLRKFSVVLEGLYDANGDYDNGEVNSNSGYLSILGSTTRSIMKVEFIVLELIGQEVKWLKNLI